MFFLICSIVNSVICLSFVQTYRRGLKNILCSCYRIQNNNLVAKREQVTLKGVKTSTEKNNNELLRTATSYHNHRILWQTFSPKSCSIIWLQKYARCDWLLSGHYFLVMTGHFFFFFFFNITLI